MRYIWGVSEARPSSAAAKFESYGEDPFRFVPLYDNGKYRAYYFVTLEQIKRVEEYIKKGKLFFNEGNAKPAEECFVNALSIYSKGIPLE